MKIEPLFKTPLGTAFVAGEIVRSNTPVLRACVVARRSYLIKEADAEHVDRWLKLDPSPANHTVLMADQDSPFREADIALEKARADVVVLGTLAAGADAGEVHVNGARWMRRTAINLADHDNDSQTHLFGYLARTHHLRLDGDEDDPDFVWPTDYGAGSNNYYKRGGSFGASLPGHSLPDGAHVEISETNSDGDESTFTFTLPADLTLTARHFTYCGHGPDKPRHWNPSPPITLIPDTLIIEPSAMRAVILWRGGWDLARHPMDRYRTIQLIEGGFH